MTKWSFTINYPSLYLNAESDDEALLKDIEEVVEQVLRRTYRNFDFGYGDDDE
jgi:hypothetical protein